MDQYRPQLATAAAIAGCAISGVVALATGMNVPQTLVFVVTGTAAGGGATVALTNKAPTISIRPAAPAIALPPGPPPPAAPIAEPEPQPQQPQVQSQGYYQPPTLDVAYRQIPVTPPPRQSGARDPRDFFTDLQ